MNTIILNTVGSSYSVKNVKEWLKSVTLISRKGETREIYLGKNPISCFLNSLQTFLEEEVIIDNNNWIPLLEEIFYLYLNKKVKFSLKGNQAKLKLNVGVGSNNIELRSSKDSLKILKMNYWENNENSNDVRIFVKVIDNNDVECEYYIHKNGKRYYKADVKETLSQYHLGDMSLKELSFTGCKTVEEMFQSKGKWN